MVSGTRESRCSNQDLRDRVNQPLDRWMNEFFSWRINRSFDDWSSDSR